MHNPIVFIVDKPSALRNLAPLLSSRFPNKKIYAIATLYIGLYQFSYPRGLKMPDFPFVDSPRWQKRPVELSPVFKVKNGEAKRCDLECSQLLRNAENIWFTSDPDASGAISFHTLLSESIGESLACTSWPAMRLLDLTDRGITKSFEDAGATTDEWFTSILNAGIARRFFDFNYNINSMALISPALRQAQALGQDHSISKYGLQLLYGLRDGLSCNNIGKLIHAMERWEGTGRYKDQSLGSAASRWQIIKDLISLGLIAEPDEQVELSTTGKAFLDLLHPDCFDIDLPGRIREWEQNWPASQPSIERYIRTFFGKQKRFGGISHH